MIVPVGPVRVALADLGDRVCAHQAKGGFEPQSLAAWADLCAGRGIVVDVGAYTGVYSIAAAKLGCTVVAFEPFPANADRLMDNAKRNRMGRRIRVIEAAAYAVHGGSAVLSYNPAMTGLTSGASLVPGVAANTARLIVAATTIDLLGLGSCAAIKIDVERAEAEVLMGARSTLERCRPTLLIEVLGKAEGRAVRALLPDYQEPEVLDGRNWLVRPC